MLVSGRVLCRTKIHGDRTGLPRCRPLRCGRSQTGSFVDGKHCLKRRGESRSADSHVPGDSQTGKKQRTSSNCYATKPTCTSPSIVRIRTSPRFTRTETTPCPRRLCGDVYQAERHVKFILRFRDEREGSALRLLLPFPNRLDKGCEPHGRHSRPNCAGR